MHIAGKEQGIDCKHARDQTSPPKYRLEDPLPQELTASLRKLDFSAQTIFPHSNTGFARTGPSSDECIAHLKFLSVLANLRDETSQNEGLFGISDDAADAFGDNKEKAIAKLREKRWAVYVARAVDRFETWFSTLPASNVGTGQEGLLRMKDIIGGSRFENLVKPGQPKLTWMAERIPPLDVLMVLHSSMLNPRSFLEDCIRHNKMTLWHAGFPWAQVDACINSETSHYTAKTDATATFEAATSRAWDNLRDSPAKQVLCPGCHSSLACTWTDGHFGPTVDHAFEGGRGFADKQFSVDCESCSIRITHETLRLIKFRRDIDRLQELDFPLPGTILSVKGIPKAAPLIPLAKGDVLFPNRLVLAGLGQDLKSLTDPRNINIQKMTAIRSAFEKALKNRRLVSGANNTTFASSRLTFDQKVSIRRMMSRYWENSSPSGIDLVGAVLRQGVFVAKMKSIDWIHSPALESTINRLLNKYSVFFQIMAENRGHVAVPTLDVDLAWHTHQLNPSAYFAYSVQRMGDEFIDHDDKIDENKLSDAFEWTSKRYQKITGGQIYSECTCWYCEAVREAHNNRSLFSSSETSVAKSLALKLHDTKDISGDPERSPHISAHNAVRAQSLTSSKAAAKLQRKLDSDYRRAVYRAKSAGKTPPTRDNYAMAYVWGSYTCVPTYAPYASDPCMTGSMYSSNPSCMNASPNAPGNCVSGSCGGGVSFGACAGAASGCGAGSACAGGGAGGGCGGGGGGG